MRSLVKRMLLILLLVLVFNMLVAPLQARASLIDDIKRWGVRKLVEYFGGDEARDAYARGDSSWSGRRTWKIFGVKVGVFELFINFATMDAQLSFEGIEILSSIDVGVYFEDVVVASEGGTTDTGDTTGSEDGVTDEENPTESGSGTGGGGSTAITNSNVLTINTYKTFQGVGYSLYFDKFFNDPSDKDLLLYVPGYSYLQGIVYANGDVKALGPIRVIGGIIENNPDKSIVLEKGAMLTTNPDYIKSHISSSSVKLKVTKWEEVK